MAETNFVPNLGEFIELTSGPVPLFSGAGAPSSTPAEGSLYIDTSNGDIYQFTNNSWTIVSNGGGGSGTTQIATGSSDPVGAPAAGIVFFARTDVIRVLQWNGSAWVPVVSEI